MEQCKKCGEFNYPVFGGDLKECQCQPFNVINEDDEEYGDVYAPTDRDAALKYAEISNVDGDYYLMNDEAEITVNGKKFCIGAEPSINYSACEVSD